MSEKIIIDPMVNNNLINFNKYLNKYLIPVIYENRPLIILCIGTDRSTGDSLGPLVGYKLSSFHHIYYKNVYIYGTLKNPVHAKNLKSILTKIESNYSNPFIIAIDSCLGSIDNIGKIIIENKPLSPGAALKKDLPKVGNISITGIVNISGTLDFIVLQNTRLYTVMTLAEAIYRGINFSIIKCTYTLNTHSQTISTNDFKKISSLQNE